MNVDNILNRTAANEGKCPMIMYQNLRKTIATVPWEHSKILQAPDSDVSLQIPKGSKGLFTMEVHTDITRLEGGIPDSGCIISPLVEVRHTELTSEVKDDELPFHILKILHSLQNREQFKDVTVWRGNMFKKDTSFKGLQLRNHTTCDSDSYEIDDNYITVFTRRFSTFVCTSCKNSCQATVMLFVLGYLECRPNASDTLAQIKSFVCSDLYRIKDFRKVRNSPHIY